MQRVVCMKPALYYKVMETIWNFKVLTSSVTTTVIEPIPIPWIRIRKCTVKSQYVLLSPIPLQSEY